MKTLPHHRLSRRLLALFVLLTLWESMSRFGWLDPFYLPAASAVANVLIELVASGQLWPHLQATFVAAFGGLVAGLGLGIGLGFAAALLPLFAGLLGPIIGLVNPVPRVVLAAAFVSVAR